MCDCIHVVAGTKIDVLYGTPGRGYLSGDTSAMGDVGESPGESCLFSLTPSADPGIGLSGDTMYREILYDAQTKG